LLSWPSKAIKRRNCVSENLDIPRCAIAHLRFGADAPSRNDDVRGFCERHYWIELPEFLSHLMETPGGANRRARIQILRSRF
jgi:hypothetical protein